MGREKERGRERERERDARDGGQWSTQSAGTYADSASEARAVALELAGVVHARSGVVVSLAEYLGAAATQERRIGIEWWRLLLDDVWWCELCCISL